MKKINFLIVFLFSILVLSLSGCTSTNNEFNVGNSSFILPNEFKEAESLGYYDHYGNTIDLNNSGNVTGLSVVEFFNKSQMDLFLEEEFSINNKTYFNEYYKEYNKTIGNVRVWVIDDREIGTRTYLFEKNSTYYVVDIFFRDKSDRSDYPGSLIINSLKST